MGDDEKRGWHRYVPLKARLRQAEREMQKLAKTGQSLSPIVIEGRTIAHTFWGRAWCDNLEHYSDFANRMPRGRTYVRNRSVVDLQIEPGRATAMVNGSQLYDVEVKIAAVPKARWDSICVDCSGAIDSLVELLEGRFSTRVMERICQQETGLFPTPSEIAFTCSCPDRASMCKHVAAVLYGIGARLDARPELLFELRQVDEKDLIARAGEGLPLAKQAPAKERVLATDRLSELFGLELAELDASEPDVATSKPVSVAETSAEPTKTREPHRTGEPRAEPKRSKKTKASTKRATAKKTAAKKTTKTSAGRGEG